MNRATTSIGGLAFRYLSRRASTPLTGIPSLKKLMTLLRLAPTHVRPVRLRGRGRSGPGSRRPRTDR